MKILLTTLNKRENNIDLNLAYLYSIAAPSKMDIVMQEFAIDDDNDYIYTELMRGAYDIIYFQCCDRNLKRILDLCRNTKKAKTGIQIILGGESVSYCSREIMENEEEVDFVIRGETEIPFFQLCREIVTGDYMIGRVNNLTYRNGESICETSDAPLPVMRKLKFPYEEIELERLSRVEYETARGCPYRCAFCTSSTTGSVRNLPLERVVKEIDFLLDKDPKAVRFRDKPFNVEREFTEAVWQHIIDNDNGCTTFEFNVQTEKLDRKEFELLQKARAGLFRFNVRVESLNLYTLQEVGRDKNIDPVLFGIRSLKDVEGVRVIVNLMAGLPYDDNKTFAHTFNSIVRTEPDEIRIGFLRLKHGTKLFDDREKYGYVYSDSQPHELISNDFISSMDVVKLKMIASVVDKFYNGGYFRRTLKTLCSETETSGFNLYERLAEFYFGRRYQHNKKEKAEDLYRIIFEYTMKQEPRMPGITEKVVPLIREDMEENLSDEQIETLRNREV